MDHSTRGRIPLRDLIRQLDESDMLWIPDRKRRAEVDGLYQVQYKGITAGFVIRGGEVAECAPILVKRFEYFRTIAKRIGD